MRFWAAASPGLGLLVLAACVGCKSASKESPAPKRAPELASVSPAPLVEAPADHYEFLSHLDGCELEHQGILLDFGAPGLQARRRFSVAPFNEGSIIDREGATFERVQTASSAFDIWLERPLEKPTLSLRVHGGAAKFVHLAIDDLRLGALRLPGDETRVLASAPGGTPLARGRHRILVRFSGAPRSNKGALAEIDWLRLGEPDPEPARYAAPTRDDVVSDVALDRIPKKSLVLRAPSTVRCWLRPSADARLKLSVGLFGSGKGVAEVRAVRDGEAPVVLQTRKIAGGDGATWTPVSLDLGAYASSLIGLEFSALEATRGGRVAFGDPAIVRRAEAPAVPPRARLAVVVMLSASERARLPPWGPTGALKTLGELARLSTVWSRHRVPSSVPAAVAGSLLTGLTPDAHGLSDLNSRLALENHLLSEIVKEASGRTAMFTGVPSTFAPFGFEQGWDVFDVISPVKDLPSSEPIQRATRWLEQTLDEGRGAPVFALVHARGAHPPWDASREEAQHLRPPDYAGIVDPRRGGIVIGALRHRHKRGKRLSDDDWTRLRALGDASLAKQDAALGQLVATLKRRGVWDDTLLVVTGDVAPGEPPEFPFDPRGALSEDRLLVPLMIKLPGGALGGKELQVPSSVEDLTVTLLAALGLPVPPQLDGLDLYARALGREPLVARAQVAALSDRYATRVGAWLLRGQIGAVPSLCALDVDPACASDAFDRELVAARALWQATFATLSGARKAAPPEPSRRPVTLDADTAAALVVWGDQ
jgi:arylsulfatase A-like enzyme